MEGRIITYSPPDECGNAASLQTSLNHWLKNDQTKICCKLDSNTHLQCSGLRKYKKRNFVNGAPVVWSMNITNCPYKIPLTLNLGSQKYNLLGITYGNGGHFTANIRVTSRKKWFFYDGLKEYGKRGTGLKQISKLVPPTRYHQSHCIFVKSV